MPIEKSQLRIFLLLLLVLCVSGCTADKEPEQATTIRNQSDVIVIGAGLSGLYAAMLMEDAGLSVQVLEARDRIGGRLFTLDDISGKPEAGGNVIAPAYSRVVNVANRLGVELVAAPDLVGGRRNMGLYVDGDFIEIRDWPTHPGNPFPDALKSVPPGSVVNATLRNNPLSKPSDWLMQETHVYDIPLREHLDKLGFSANAQALGYHVSSYGDDPDDGSLLHMYKAHAVMQQMMKLPGGLMAVAGGNQRLPEAMAAALSEPVRLDSPVTLIEQQDAGVSVKVEDGSVFHARFVVAAIPFTALRSVHIKPTLPVTQQQAIDELSYNATLQVHLLVSEPYSGQNPPSVWSDRDIERVMATSKDGSGDVTNAVIWIDGSNARRLSQLPPEDRDRVIMDDFFTMYPDARGKVQLQRVVDWVNDPYAGGAWADWAPGQISEFINVMSKPHKRLHFAGEHTAVSNPGMEGAMESGERAANEVIAAASTAANQSASRGELLFARCQACHSIGENEPHKTGPNLHGIIGKASASSVNYQYTDALKEAKLVWDDENLRRWIEDPSAVAPGTSMIYMNTLTSEEIGVLIDYLRP
ncbi:MAG TPA: FAD-dependent oxidoreductase [Woeseiaceae bacterium]|nr:FAD-dependent oxidoreductase [Woeseiaceae bacterium]